MSAAETGSELKDNAIDLLFVENRILPFEKLLLQNKLIFFHLVEYNYAPRSFTNI